MIPQLKVTPEGLTRFLPLSKIAPLKNIWKMLFFQRDFGELSFDGLIHTGVLSSALVVADLRKIRLLATPTNLNGGPPPEIQILIANGQLKTPCATVELQLEVGDITFGEKFIVMTNLTILLIGLLLQQSNSTVLVMR